MKKIGISFLVGGVLLVGVSFAAEDQVICTMNYTPVCAEVKVQCIKAPCPAMKQTFGNKCTMNANKLANFLYEGECKEESQNDLNGTSRTIQSFDNEISTGASLMFSGGKIFAKICNNMSSNYTTEGSSISIGLMMSTKMACMGDIAIYEDNFDLSGAKYEISTDGGNHLMITTANGHTYQRQNTNPNPGKVGIANPASTFCIENSGSLEMLDGTGGQYGMCSFVDGSKCEERAFFRGECKPEYKKIHSIFDKYFKNNENVFQKVDDKKTFLQNFKSQIELLSNGARLSLKRTYQKIIQAITLYF